MIKKIGIGIGVLLLLIVVGLVVVLKSLGSFITPEFVVKQIESNLNVRAEVKEVNINLFSALSSVGVNGIKLGRRDAVADQGTPLSEREPMQSSTLSIDEVDLGISLGAILKQEFRLDKLLLINPKISLVLFEKGGTNLTNLFKPPVTVNGEPNPKLDPAVLELRKKEEQELANKKLEEVEPKEPFSIKTVPVAISMGELGLKNANITVLMQKTKQVIKLDSTNLILKNLDIIPDDLENHNKVDLNLSFNLSVLGPKGNETGKFILSSGGSIKPFDPATGRANPGLVHNVTIKEGSYISGFAAFDSLAGGLPALKSLNIKMDKLAQKAELNQDVTTKLAYTQGRVIFKDSPSFPTQNYDLKITEGTWIQLTNSTHLMKGKILVTKLESDKALSGMNKALEANAKGMDTSKIKQQILGNLLEKDRIALPFQSSGQIMRPQVRLGIELPSITNLFKGAVKEALKGKLPSGAKDALKQFGF